MSYPDDTTSRFTISADGLRLHYRDLGPPASSALPVVCLPGLTRTSEDFDLVATTLASGSPNRGGPPRRVLALDYRGRGGSDHDPDPAHYNVMVEAADVLAVMAAAGIGQAVFLGTSRGGLITFVIAATRPEAIRGTVLNDIGPVLEPVGLERIRGYVGKLPPPRDWPDAVRILRGYSQDFTGLDENDWLAFARTTFADRDGVPQSRYDPALMASLRDLDLSNLPALWPQFDGLAHAPLLVVRGANSDLLSEATAAEMVRRHPDASLQTVPDQGHAPLLRDNVTLTRIAAFVDHCDHVDHAPPA